MTTAAPLRRLSGRTRTRPEDAIQASIVAYLRTVLPASRYRVFAVPNGGFRTKTEAARMKTTGTLAGVYDVCILGPCGASYWIETKAADGRLSDPQKDMRAWMESIAVPHVMARSIDDVRAALRHWGLESREAA